MNKAGDAAMAVQGGSVARRGARRAALAAAVCGVATGVVALAGTSPALAATGTVAPDVALAVSPPSSLGFGGGPVEFTEQVTNRGTQALPATLAFKVYAGQVMCDAISMRAEDASGTWSDLPLTCHSDASQGAVFQGTLPYDMNLAPGASTTVHLALGVPMGTQDTATPTAAARASSSARR